MTDNLTKAQRSLVMSHIRNKWTLQEKKVHAWLSSKKVKHRMHPKIEGNPDIVLVKQRSVIFLNGCFWHGCPKCYKEPKTNRKYWIPKIVANKTRDRKVHRLLKDAGWNVKVVWEHQLRENFNRTCSRLL